MPGQRGASAGVPSFILPQPLFFHPFVIIFIKASPFNLGSFILTDDLQYVRVSLGISTHDERIASFLLRSVMAFKPFSRVSCAETFALFFMLSPAYQVHKLQLFFVGLFLASRWLFVFKFKKNTGLQWLCLSVMSFMADMGQ